MSEEKKTIEEWSRLVLQFNFDARLPAQWIIEDIERMQAAGEPISDEDLADYAVAKRVVALTDETAARMMRESAAYLEGVALGDHRMLTGAEFQSWAARISKERSQYLARQAEELKRAQEKS